MNGDILCDNNNTYFNSIFSQVPYNTSLQNFTSDILFVHTDMITLTPLLKLNPIVIMSNYWSMTGNMNFEGQTKCVKFECFLCKKYWNHHNLLENRLPTHINNMFICNYNNNMLLRTKIQWNFLGAQMRRFQAKVRKLQRLPLVIADSRHARNGE